MIWQSYFPYTPRFSQDKICDFVSKSISERKIAVVEAPYGIGKTASMLASGLASGKKLVFATCDHAVQNTIVKEVLNINEKLDDELNKKLVVASIIGKEHMCLHLSHFNYDACDFEKMHQQCPFYKNTYKKGKISKGITEKTEKLLSEIEYILKNNPNFLKNKSFVNFVINKCKEADLCPYEVMLELAAKANIVILDYFHVFTPILLFMRKRVFNPEKSVLFIDEADRLKDRLLDILTRDISDKGLYRLKTQIKKAMKMKRKEIGMSEWLENEDKDIDTKEMESKSKNISHAQWLFYLRFVETFEEFLAEKEKSIKNKNENKNEKKGAKKEEGIYIDIKKQEFIDFLESRLYSFDEIIDKIKDIIDKLTDSTGYKKAVLQLDEFLRLWKNFSENYFAYVLLNNKKSLVMSHYELASAPLIEEGNSSNLNDSNDSKNSKHLYDILKSFYSCVLFSATIGNKDIFAESLGITDFEEFSSEEFNTQNYLVILKQNVSSIYRERQANVSKVVKDMDFCRKTAQGVLISFPSYDCRNSVLHYLNAKPIQDAESQGIYYVVTGGKGSRGINKAAKLNVAYIYGLQIAKPYDYLFNKRKEFALKKHGQEKALKLIYNNVVNKSCQTAGRIFREADKKGIVVLADRRYKYDFQLKNFFFDCIPSYFKVKMIEIASQEKFEKIMTSFWQNN